MVYIFFIIWFILLIKWADFMVDWASSIAKRLKISPLIIWLTIVAFWTSAPELIVNIISAIQWETDLALWNILWSNSVNILLILGITSVIYPITLKFSTVYKEIPFCILSTLILLIMANDIFLNFDNINILSRSEWFLLLTFFVIYLSYIFSQAKVSYRADIKEAKQITSEIVVLKNWVAILYVVGWILGLAIGSKWVVDWAVEIAEFFWLSEVIIWLTIVAIGTSLPELITSVVAARKKEADLAIWNIVGSNIFNTFFILWITSVIKPVDVPTTAQLDIWVNIIATILLFMFVFTWKRTFLWEKKNILSKTEWIILFSLYIVYLVYIVWVAMK